MSKVFRLALTKAMKSVESWLGEMVLKTNEGGEAETNALGVARNDSCSGRAQGQTATGDEAAHGPANSSKKTESGMGSSSSSLFFIRGQIGRGAPNLTNFPVVFLKSLAS